MKNEKKVKESKNEWKQNDGFTFVETIAVLTITAVLAAGTTVSAGKLIAKARRISATSQIEEYSAGLRSFFLDCGRYPTTEQGLEALWQKPELYPVPENWDGPYLEKQPGKDPWGRNYIYQSRESGIMPGEVPEKLPFVLYSYGADGEEGGEGENQDVVSWK
ncbi:MAG: type II secretion system major pseudopilin GspG [Treponema sp.]|nr:type II secretion system major pseudopilin GspG [Treponema sp.]